MLNLFKRGPKQPPIESNINSLICKGNDYFAAELILLNERLTGNFYCAEDIVIERMAQFTGNIAGKNCIISGKTTGDITATEHLFIRESAVINGNVNAPAIDIEPGAVINGIVKTGTDIYAMVGLADKLKWNLVTEELPAKLSIAADSVVVPSRTDEPVKIPVQKASVPKPATAPVLSPKPVMAEVAVTTAPAAKPVAPKPAMAEVAATTAPTAKPVAPKPVAAAPIPKPQPASTDVVESRWW